MHVAHCIYMPSIKGRPAGCLGDGLMKRAIKLLLLYPRKCEEGTSGPGIGGVWRIRC